MTFVINLDTALWYRSTIAGLSLPIIVGAKDSGGPGHRANLVVTEIGARDLANALKNAVDDEITVHKGI